MTTRDVVDYMADSIRNAMAAPPARRPSALRKDGDPIRPSLIRCPGGPMRPWLIHCPDCEGHGCSACAGLGSVELYQWVDATTKQLALTVQRVLDHIEPTVGPWLTACEHCQGHGCTRCIGATVAARKVIAEMIITVEKLLAQLRNVIDVAG